MGKKSPCSGVGRGKACTTPNHSPKAQATRLHILSSSTRSLHVSSLPLRGRSWGLREATPETPEGFPMACFFAGNAFIVPTISSSPSSSSTMGGGARISVAVASASRLVVLSCQRRDFYGPLAARLLGPPTKFEASKLKVVFTGEEMEKHAPSTIHRAYTLTHCDFTANLTLSVSNNIHSKMLMDWQTRLNKDDVVAEWKKVNEEISLHVHCFVSGTSLLQDLAAEFRYHIFSKELPLVLKAVVHGDSALFSKHPELMEAEVWVYFHSKSMKYNRLECWGALKDAAQRTLDGGFDTFRASVFDSLVKFSSPKTILHALVAFLL